MALQYITVFPSISLSLWKDNEIIAILPQMLCKIKNTDKQTDVYVYTYT